MSFWRWLISAPDENPFNKMPNKMKYGDKRDFRPWGKFGKARPIWGCLFWLLFIALLILRIATEK